MTAYATVADMEANVAGWVTDDPDALDALLERASQAIDGQLGARPVITTGDFAGFKVDPGELEPWRAAALALATCQQAAYMNAVGPDAEVRGAATKTSGPHFSVERQAAPGGGRLGPAVPGLVNRTGLRVAWSSMRPSGVGR